MLPEKNKVLTMLDRRVDIRSKSLTLLAMKTRLDLLEDSNANVNAGPTRKGGPIVRAIGSSVKMSRSSSRIRPLKFSDGV
jgi:hypothetical protein